MAILSAAAGPALADSAVPALTGSSSAAVLHAKFSVNGNKTDYGPELLTTGTAPPAYDKKTVKSSYAKTSKSNGFTFYRSATGVQSAVTGHADTATGIATTGTTTINAAKAKLTSDFGTLVTVTTGKITAQSSFTQTKAGVRSVKGSTSLLNVHIDAPSFGFNKTYSGNPKPNQVLYHNSDNSVVIYLNRQITTTVGGTPSQLTVAAVDVEVTNYKFAGQTFSGTLLVAPTLAK